MENNKSLVCIVLIHYFLIYLFMLVGYKYAQSDLIKLNNIKIIIQLEQMI